MVMDAMLVERAAGWLDGQMDGWTDGWKDANI